MPGRLQAFIEIKPLSHVAIAANDTGGTGGSLAWSLIATAAITAPLALRLYRKRDDARVIADTKPKDEALVRTLGADVMPPCGGDFPR
ncbi:MULTISPECIES: hypothetical protein [unclassified Nonomuraea]|uniref:hypothetical protein n=1 Tax=unclassified Nonomuraea TaxID=2593643 RepID=UPI0033EEB427